MVKIQHLLSILSYGVVITGISPLYIWLDSPARILLPVALLAGIYSDIKERYFLPATLATLLSITFFLLYIVQLNLNNVVDPVVNIIALLLAVRLATIKNNRNYLQLFMLSLFALASSSLYSLTIFYFPALVLLVFGITTGLVLLTFYNKEPSMQLSRLHFLQLLKTSAILPVASLLLMLLFFAILPRTEHPLWHLMQPDEMVSSSVGFTEEVKPGNYTSLSTSRNLAFRAQCPELPPEALYWRGTVLNHIEGAVWSRVPQIQEAADLTGGRFVDCVYYYPPKMTRFLFTLDLPAKISGIRHTGNDDYVFKADKPLQHNTRFTARSRMGANITTVKDDIDTSNYLQLPDKLSDRMVQAADAIKRQGKTDKEKITLLQSFFEHQNLQYATDDLPESEQPIDAFLFEKKRGYCEFFASSFALLSRMIGVPVRLVGGYLGGNYNELGGYYHITEDMAHVWVEVLIENEWQRIDPTSFAQNFSENPLRGQGRKFSFFRKSLDSIEYFWIHMVITYDFQKQVKLAFNTRAKLRSLHFQWNDFTHRIFYMLLLVALLIAASWTYRQKKHTTVEKRLVKRYRKELQKRYKGKKIPKNMGLFELADFLQNPVCTEFASIIGPCIYGTKPLSKSRHQRLEQAIQHIKDGK